VARAGTGTTPPSDHQTTDDRLARVEGQVAHLQKIIFQRDMTIEGLILCLQAADNLGQIEFDIDLLIAATATAKEYVKRGGAGEFCDMAREDVLDLRFDEFWAANFE